MKKLIAEDLLNYLNKKQNEVEEFCVGLDKDFNRTYCHEDDSVFTVTRERATDTYYYCSIEDDIRYILAGYCVFKDYIYDIMPVPIIFDEEDEFTVDDIYDITSLTSSETLLNLLKKMRFTIKGLTTYGTEILKMLDSIPTKEVLSLFRNSSRLEKLL